MRVTVSKWGNSLGLRIPRRVAEDAQLSEGAVVDLRVEGGRLIAEPVEAFDLDELLARVTPENLHGDAFDARRGGREIL